LSPRSRSRGIYNSETIPQKTLLHRGYDSARLLQEQRRVPKEVDEAVVYGNKRDYPKIDIYSKSGKYLGTTTWAKNTKIAVEQYAKSKNVSANEIHAHYQDSKARSTVKKENSPQIKIINTTSRQWLGICLSVIILTGILYFIMKNYTNASNPFWDGLVSAGSIVATWMLAQKIIEQWLLWIVIDGISIGLFIYKNLNLTAILFFVYTILAIIGYFQWKKQLEQQIN